VELPLDQILFGDCLDLLKDLPDGSVDAVVTDPPYGLGNKDPAPEDLFMFVLGGSLDMGGDFMGRDWDIPSISIWREVYRVLKPGGHVLSFGGTRTFDLVSVGLRMAGFESRDTIAREYPVLQWVQGQGMPKSKNIHGALEGKVEPGAAATWKGWGSGLKPSWEPILVFRKPLEGTLVKNVMTHGTGGLNIDATRVRHASKEDFEAHKKGVDAIREKGGSRDKSWKNASDLSGANEVTASGRWPSNLLLQHSASCRKVGTQEIAPHPQGPDRFQKTTGGKFSEAYGNQLASDKPEVMPVWECADGCPVQALDEQSGDRPSTLTGRADPNGSHQHPGREMHPNSAFLGERTHLSRVYADAGGASRFFTQIQGEEWECVDGCPVKALDDQSGDRRSNLTGRADPNVTHVDLAKPSDKVGFMRGSTLTHTSTAYADSGGASRFFTQLEGEDAAKGRWPSNSVWVHSEGCQRIGTKRVKASKGGAGILWSHLRDGKTDEAMPSESSVGDADGLETVQVWSCVEGCPVKELHEQGIESGSHAAGNKGETNHVRGNKVYGGGFKPLTNNPDYHADEGGVDRFFAQFEAEGGVPFRYIPKANRKEAGCGEFEVQHITVKPLELMRWLVRLVTRKGGIVLDPYCGSGSTLHAAVLEGMHFIGIERHKESYEEAQRRLGIVARRERERREDEAVFEFAMGGGSDAQSEL
jgi:DNA modification methylase